MFETLELRQFDRLSDIDIATLQFPIEDDSVDSQQIDTSIQNLRDDLQRVTQLIRIFEWLASGEPRHGEHG